MSLREALKAASSSRVVQFTTEWFDEPLFVRLLSGKDRDSIERFFIARSKPANGKSMDGGGAEEEAQTSLPVLAYLVSVLLCEGDGARVYGSDYSEDEIGALPAGLINDIVIFGCNENRMLRELVNALNEVNGTGEPEKNE